MQEPNSTIVVAKGHLEDSVTQGTVVMEDLFLDMN